MKNIILIAAPAAGKGTQAKMLKEKYNYAHISAGDLLRDAAKVNDETGNYINKQLKDGKLVSEEIMFDILKKRITQADCKNGYILDGFPRTLEQAEYYEELIKTLNYDLGLVIFIDVLKSELERRIVGRRICEECGFIYNINFEDQKPSNDNLCDKCGGKLYQRSDDNKDSFETRYQTYLNMTKPLIDYYENIGVLHKINGGINKETTFNSITTIINK
ncbi:MAG: nucleoside monophosphate kinase [Bacilli bacterium]